MQGDSIVACVLKHPLPKPSRFALETDCSQDTGHHEHTSLKANVIATAYLSRCALPEGSSLITHSTYPVVHMETVPCCCRGLMMQIKPANGQQSMC